MKGTAVTCGHGLIPATCVSCAPPPRVSISAGASTGAQPWQCPLCGTVYAWWVSKCREKHAPKAADSSGTSDG